MILIVQLRREGSIISDTQGKNMRTRLAFVAAFVSLVVLSVQATAEDALANVKSVAVVSAIGDCLNLIDVGTAGILTDIFNPQCLPTDSWAIDDLVTGQITDAIGGRFAVKSVTYDRSQFTHLPVTSLPVMPTELTQALQRLQNPGVDAYIVVTKLQLGNVISDASTPVSGIGIAHEGSLLLGDTNRMYAFYIIRIVDARSFALLAIEGSHLPKTGLLPRVPAVDVDDSMWSDRAAEMTEAQKTAAKAQTQTLVRDSIASTLHYMNLTQ